MALLKHTTPSLGAQSTIHKAAAPVPAFRPWIGAGSSRRAPTSKRCPLHVASVLSRPAWGQSSPEPQESRARSRSPVEVNLAEQAHQAIREWCTARGAEAVGQQQTPHLETYDLAWDGPQGSSCGQCVIAGLTTHDDADRPTAVIALAAHVSREAHDEPLQLIAHWAVSRGLGKRWRAPPAGWHTRPDASYDAGGGAWQSPMESVPVVGQAPVHVLVLQIPLSGTLRDHGSGVALVFKTGSGEWIKQAGGSSSQRSGATTDLFFPAGAQGGAAASRAGSPTSSSRLSAPQPHREKSDASSSGEHWGSTREREGTPARSTTPDQRPPTPSTRSAAGSGQWGGQQEVSGLTHIAKGLTLGELDSFILRFKYQPRASSDLLESSGHNSNSYVCDWMVNDIANREHDAQRSLMHRFSIAADLLNNVRGAHGDDRVAALTVLTAWLRLSAQRLLVWNRNYNVKPREISAAQDKLCLGLAELYAQGSAEEKQLARLALLSVGRGGAGDVGQRVRDEILDVQQRNGAKGGMMEEWHQKLHNNTSPDDVVICEALLAYLDSGLDISRYWAHLHANGINAERLRSFDRPIVSEPRFSSGQVAGLTRDLTAYLSTLRAVHGGADLASGAQNVLGYYSQGLKGNKSINVEPVPGVATPELRMVVAAALRLQALLAKPHVARGSRSSPQVDGDTTDAATPPHGLGGAVRLMELLLEARHMIRPAILGGDAGCGGRLRDVLFLDMALEGAGRAALEASLGDLRTLATAAVQQQQVSTVEALAALDLPGRQPSPGGTTVSVSQRINTLLAVTCLALEGAALSLASNGELVSSLKWLVALQGMSPSAVQARDRALQALAVMDRLKRVVGEQAGWLGWRLQPTAEALGHRLGVDGGAVGAFSEEVVRGTAAAPLSQVLGIVEPCLRKLTGGGDWQVVSRGPPQQLQGVVRVEHSLGPVQHEVFGEPTVLVVDAISGAEEVPEGCVAVISTGGCPDMLSHSAVRARNMNVMLAACSKGETNGWLKSIHGQWVRVTLQGADVHIEAS